MSCHGHGRDIFIWVSFMLEIHKANYLMVILTAKGSMGVEMVLLVRVTY